MYLTKAGLFLKRKSVSLPQRGHHKNRREQRLVLNPSQCHCLLGAPSLRPSPPFFGKGQGPVSDRCEGWAVATDIFPEVRTWLPPCESLLFPVLFRHWPSRTPDPARPSTLTCPGETQALRPRGTWSHDASPLAPPNPSLCLWQIPPSGTVHRHNLKGRLGANISGILMQNTGLLSSEANPVPRYLKGSLRAPTCMP